MKITANTTIDELAEILRKAAKRIREEVPTARFQQLDYGATLEVASHDLKKCFTVYQIGRPHQSEIIGNVDQIIAALRDV